LSVWCNCSNYHPQSPKDIVLNLSVPQGCLVSTIPIGKIPQVRILGEDSAPGAELKPNVGVAPKLILFCIFTTLLLFLFFFNFFLILVVAFLLKREVYPLLELAWWQFACCEPHTRQPLQLPQKDISLERRFMKRGALRFPLDVRCALSWFTLYVNVSKFGALWRQLRN
jgi:hypothetical protein